MALKRAVSTGFGLILVAALAGASVPAVADEGARIIADWEFSSGADGWIGTNRATVSELARRPGGRSLKIEQTEDREADSAWRSPILEGTGKPVQVRFWAADNYTVQPDLTYAAAVGLAACDAEGNTAPAPNWTSISWDEGRREAWWGPLTPAGLVWKAYEATLSPPAGRFRVVFFWPKTLTRGACLLTEVSVREAAAAPAAAEPRATAAPAAGPALRLELTTPAVGNLFHVEDPLRIEALLFDPTGKPLPAMVRPVVHYDITDYLGGRIASGTVPFDHAAPRPFDRADPKADRRGNLWQSFVLEDRGARESGRLFYLRAVLRDGERALAEDTIPYGVVDPRPLDPRDHERSRFVSFEGNVQTHASTESKLADQSIRAKVGVLFTQDWDYRGWREAQPAFPGPMNVKPMPGLPKLVYCPNLEQIRGRLPNHPWGDVGAMAPEGACIDDPLRPGSKTFDIDGYVAYLVARVRAQREAVAMVVASGLERPIDERTIELQRKAYAALKREFPDLPVGMMLYGLFSNPSRQAETFLREKLYEVADFVDDHMYSPSMDWTEWERVRDTAKAQGKDLFFISTEFSRVGGRDQLERSRAMVTSHLEGWSRGLRKITYFNVRADVDQPVLRGDVPGDGFQWMQIVKRPLVSEQIAGTRRPTHALMPLLQTMTYHNLVRNFEGAEHRASFKPGPHSVAHVFSRDGRTICALYLTRPVAPETLAIDGDVPMTVQDLFGRTERLEPSQAALVSATLDPIVLLFDREVPRLHDPAEAVKALRGVAGGAVAGELPRGAPAAVRVTLPGVFPRAFEAQVDGTVDGTWPQTGRQTVRVPAGAPAEAALSVRLDPSAPAGTHAYRVTVSEGACKIGLLAAPLSVSELVAVRVDGDPLAPNRDPAIVVTLRNLGAAPRSGTLRLATEHFGDPPPARDFEQPFALPPLGEAEARFVLPRWQVNPAASYLVRADVEDADGLRIAAAEEIGFRASVKTATPPTIDGDLSDWALEELVPIPFERHQNAWGKTVRDAADLDAVMYSRWDAQHLYFAVVVTDDVHIVRSSTVDIWMDDNLMLGLYPWGWRHGETLNSGYYREHMGLCLDGQARVFRVGNVPGGPGTAEGARIAVRKTATGLVYEWAYPFESLAPLAPAAGGRFRLSLAAIDRDVSKDGWGTTSAIQLGGFNLSVDAQPAKWREFVLVDPASRP